MDAPPRPTEPKNPYRDPPRFVRVGAHLRVPALGAWLPDRCVVCNGAADGRRERRVLHRIARPDSALHFVLLLFTSLLAFFWLKPVFVEFGLCAAHRRARRTRAILGVLVAVSAFAFAHLAIHAGIVWLGALLIAAFVGVVFLLHRHQAVLRLRERRGEHVLLEVPAPFLASFPEESPSERSS
jgi:hypothetical protein